MEPAHRGVRQTARLCAARSAEELTDGAVRQEVDATLARGSREATLVGGFIALLVVLGMWAGALIHLEIPLLVTSGATLLVWLGYRALRRGTLSLRTLRVAMVLLASMPVFGLVAAQLLLPVGAATYIHGALPFGALYLVGLSAFLLDPWLSRLCGWVVGLELFVVGLFALPELSRVVQLGDAVLRQDLTHLAIWAVRCGILVGTGYTAAGVGALTRRLLGRVVEEVQEREWVNRLFGVYVSPEVRERLFRQPERPLSERVEVAVLFADLRGFTTLSETLEAEELVLQLNEYFDTMVTVVHAHGGTIDKFIGDAVMAVFGGLCPLENPSAAALEAACQMRAALLDLNQRRSSRGLPPLDHGIGLHYGTVVQGPVGSATRRDYTVIGDVVNTAARIEAATRQLETHILASEALVRQLPSVQRDRCMARGPVALKGKTAAVELFSVA